LAKVLIFICLHWYWWIYVSWFDIWHWHVLEQLVLLVHNAGGSQLIQQTSTLSRLPWLWEKPRLMFYMSLLLQCWNKLGIGNSC